MPLKEHSEKRLAIWMWSGVQSEGGERKKNRSHTQLCSGDWVAQEGGMGAPNKLF